ncbi:MAG TPA: HD domain-containing protein [Gemmatimonadales bacterium]|nr:HD domain-containing protein [Gemmatimonadales bacterium]
MPANVIGLQPDVTEPSDPVVAPLGTRVEAPMLVHQIERRAWGEGREGVILVLGTSAGRIGTAPLWGERQAWAANVARGTIVHASGRVGAFRGVRQLELSGLRVAPADSVPLRALVPGTTTTIADWTVLDEARRALRRPRLRRVLGLFYDDPPFRSAYEECPASTAGHHAQLGGLLRHTVEVVAIARAVAITSGADRELVLAGAMLHDVGKLEAYAWRRGVFELTEAGALLGHVTLGMLMLDRHLARHAPDCTHREVLLLQHLIASHHGVLEHGAPVRPMTLEAEVLHYADDASAKTSSMADALASSEYFNGNDVLSARSLWQVDHRRIFRGRSEWGESVDHRGANPVTADNANGCWKAGHAEHAEHDER